MATTDCCKVGRLINRHDLDPLIGGTSSINDRLLARWTGDDGRSAIGYRSLTDWFNKQILKRTYQEIGHETIESHLASDYEILTEGDHLERIEVEDHLAATGVDVNSLKSDFISWSTMRNHLNDCLDGEKDTDPSSSSWAEESVEIARKQAAEKTKAAVRALESKRKLAQGSDAEISVQVLLECPDCPTRVSFETARERGYVCQTHLTAADTEGIGRAGERIAPTNEFIPHWTSNTEVERSPSFGI